MVPPSQQTYREDFYFSPHGADLIEQCILSYYEITGSGLGFDYEDISDPVTDAINNLHAYYCRSPTDLAGAYAHNPASLTEEEYDRLKHEGSGIERDILLTKLPPTDPIVKAIMTRLIVQMKSGYSLILWEG